ncbi:hypothetical protein O3P69_009508 [Scylla paramamosain]|uniref:Shisa N-terminal domain-containing protein n=1 Tax=Scylla paramamosain TaxID=85552 RepID=A0AAW0SVR0_SCYPA
MDRLMKVVVVVLSLAATGSGRQCEKEDFWGTTLYFNCPEPGGNPSDVFCCGLGDNKYCCSSSAQEEIIEEFLDKEAIGRQEGGHFAPLVEMISSDSSEEDGGIFTSLKGHLNHTMKIIQDGFKGTVDRLKERVKKKVKQKVKEKMVKPHLPTILGVIAAIIITIIVLCIVCCCCCPFCLLYKQRNRGTVHNPNPEVSVMQPLQSQPQTYAPQPYPAVPQQQAPYPTQPMGMQSAPAPYPPQAYPPTGYPGEQPPMYTEKQPPPYNPTY